MGIWHLHAVHIGTDVSDAHQWHDKIPSDDSELFVLTQQCSYQLWTTLCGLNKALPGLNFTGMLHEIAVHFAVRCRFHQATNPFGFVRTGIQHQSDWWTNRGNMIGRPLSRRSNKRSMRQYPGNAICLSISTMLSILLHTKRPVNHVQIIKEMSWLWTRALTLISASKASFTTLCMPTKFRTSVYISKNRTMSRSGKAFKFEHLHCSVHHSWRRTRCRNSSWGTSVCKFKSRSSLFKKFCVYNANSC